MLAQYDFQYGMVVVNGERWLHDTTWNRFLANYADDLELFGIYWSEGSGESACCPPTGMALFTSILRLSGNLF